MTIYHFKVSAKCKVKDNVNYFYVPNSQLSTQLHYIKLKVCHTCPGGATSLTVWPAIVVATLSPGVVTKVLGCTTFTVVGEEAAPVLVVIFWVAAAAAARAAIPVMPLWEVVVVVVAGRRICVVCPPAPMTLI